MKKIMATVIIIGLVLLNLSAVVSADEYLDMDPAIDLAPEDIEINEYGETSSQEVKSRVRNSYRDGEDCRPKAKFIGIWGYQDDNETIGYVGGYLTRRGRFGVLRGLWNKTDNETKGKVFGIFKKGFFNGRVVTPSGNKCHITGLYKINQENKTFHMLWMTPGKVGWAHCRIIPQD